MTYRSLGLLLIKTKGTRGEVINTCPEGFYKIGTGKGILFRFTERGAGDYLNVTEGPDNIPIVMMEPGEVISDFLMANGIKKTPVIRIITNKKSFLCRQNSDGTTVISDISFHDVEIHLDSIMVSWNKDLRRLDIWSLSGVTHLGTGAKDVISRSSSVENVDTVLANTKNSLVIVESQRRYLMVLDQMNSGPALISIPESDPPMTLIEVYHVPKSNSYLARDSEDRTWEAWASYVDQSTLADMLHRAQYLISLPKTYQAVWSSGRLASMGSKHVYLTIDDRALKDFHGHRSLCESRIPVLVRKDGIELPWTYWNGKKLTLATRKDRPCAYCAKICALDRSRMVIFTEHQGATYVDLPGIAIPGAKIIRIKEDKIRTDPPEFELSIGPLEIDSGLWEVEMNVVCDEHSGLVKVRIMKRDLIHRLKTVVVNKTPLNFRNIHRVFDSGTTVVSANDDPLDTCKILFNPVERYQQNPRVNIQSEEGTSSGNGAMRDLIHRALERFRDLYLDSQGIGTRFKPNKVRKIFNNPYHGDVLIRIIIYLLLTNSSFCSFHVPINVLASLIDRPPTIKEMIYFIRQQQGPQLGEQIVQDRFNYAQHGYSNVEEYLADYVGYDREEAGMIYTRSARKILPEGMNFASLDYHISGTYNVSLKGISLTIRNGDTNFRYQQDPHNLLSLSDPLIDKLRRAIDSFSQDQLRGFFTNITGSPVPRTNCLLIVVGISDWVNFRTCFKTVDVSSDWLENATDEEIVRDLTKVVVRMLDVPVVNTVQDPVPADGQSGAEREQLGNQQVTEVRETIFRGVWEYAPWF